MNPANLPYAGYKAPWSEQCPIEEFGDGGTIIVRKDRAFYPIVSTSSNTLTLARPTKAGIRATFFHKTDGGSLALTVTGGYNKLGYTIAIFYAVGDFLELVSVPDSTSFRWQVVSANGVIGPTEPVQVMTGNGYYTGTSLMKMWETCPSPADPRYNSLVHEYFNDFRASAADYDATNEWTYTEVDVGTGGAAALTADATCGTLTITSGANDNDCGAIVLNQTSFEIVSGKKLYYETRLKVTTAAKHIQSDWMAGLIGAGQDLKAQADNIPDNGIVFHKDDGSASLFLASADGDTNTDSAALATTAAETWYILGFYFNGGATGAGTVTPYINGVAGTPITITYATMAKLSPAFLYRNGEAGSCVFTIDYVKVVQFR